jgi:hypothetical protein
MNLDIQSILDGWPFEPGQLNVRKIIGKDGKEKIQLRLDLGLLQMEVQGRPDGQRPFGHESLLDYYEHRRRHYERSHGSDEGFKLDKATCEKLRAESTMYYHRYLSAFVLEDYKTVKRDTHRNLRVFDLCRRYAAEEDDQMALEAYRPYVIMMNTRAKVHLALAASQPKKALRVLTDGIASIRDHFHGLALGEQLENSREIRILEEIARDIEEQMPVDPVEHLERELARAVREERYEDAASLRDKLRGFDIRPDGSDPPGRG